MILKTAAALLLIAFTANAEYYTNGTKVPAASCGCKDQCGGDGGVKVTVNMPGGGGGSSTGLDSDWKRRFLELEDQVKSLIARGVSGWRCIHIHI